ncbi:MAG TPA: YaaC family protein [Thermodesulfobacteriota bacterium]|nr:YaaC family protein [Thermodesulfobacteriota bacterium]
MAFQQIQYKNKELTIHKAITKPHFHEKTVLVTDTWDYVDLWLKRSNKSLARFYWEQSHSFYEATKTLPKTSAPLTAYYCFLNAVKALLLARNINYGDTHGVTGFTIGNRTSLTNEKVKFQRGGILAALCGHLSESANGEIYTLKDLLFNLPYIHRAFDLSYSSTPELFIPISNPKIVRSTTTHEAWFCAELKDKYANQNTINKLPIGFEKDISVHDKTIIRYRHRFNWRPRNINASIQRYTNYHQRIRKHLFYIYGPQRLWYFKRDGNLPGLIQRSSLTLTFAAMHKLSELSRYTPDKLSKHFDGGYNWLLSEFIATAPLQFIDEVSSEMTGREFMIPGRASNK